jgi:hypothetical protein
MRQLKDDSQNALVLGYLAKGKKLTPGVSLRLFGSLRLAARVHELKRRGHKIKKKTVTVDDGKRIAEYFMPAARA